MPPTATFSPKPPAVKEVHNPTGCMGLADYLGLDWRSYAGIPIVKVPSCPVQPDNFMETVTYLLYQASGMSSMIPLDDKLVRHGCSAKLFTKVATVPGTTSRGTTARRSTKY